MLHHAGRIGHLRATVPFASERFGNDRSLLASTLPRRELLDNPSNGLRGSNGLRWSEHPWNELLGKSNGKLPLSGLLARWNATLPLSGPPDRSIGLPPSVTHPPNVGHPRNVLPAIPGEEEAIERGMAD
jgi:hypothetical protein